MRPNVCPQGAQILVGKMGLDVTHRSQELGNTERTLTLSQTNVAWIPAPPHALPPPPTGHAFPLLYDSLCASVSSSEKWG